MALRVNFNFEAAASHTAILSNEREMNKSLLRLSTGLRILNAADDSAGLFIADQLMVVGSGLEEGNRNIQTGLSALRIAESSAGQIFNRLNEIYKRTVRAANDINDPNARASLQREIDNFIDAIKKIGTDTEYNGIKLLDGTFAGKAIHYGARKDQILQVDIKSVLPNDIGAYMVKGQGARYVTSTATSAMNFAAHLSTTSNWLVDSGDYVDIAGIRVLQFDGTQRFVDAATLARNINSNNALQALGIEATAKNINMADADYSGFANFWTPVGADSISSATLEFYIGNAVASGSANFQVTIDSSVTTVQQLADLINTQASGSGSPISAKVINNKLVLETNNGETIAVRVSVSGNISSNGVNVNLGQILEGAGTVSFTAATNYAYYIDVGTVDIAGTDTYKIQYSGVSAASTATGFNFDLSTNADATFKNLYSVNVLTNERAEESMLIVKKALQRVDTVRAQIGAVMNNLQSIYDSQKVAWDNTKEAENVIRNTDYAEEMTNFTKLQIKMQSSMAMLAQANQLPQLVLQLLR
ncbi:flagellin [Pampinifervens florentissimum]|uniref:flagellin N-terminal helical domain-containing protein n=1 Tax=Pampinifervens florentissimum TaxID=1632019 RepID=UPI0013B49CE2|nr:flagellin [Hydrogenobacter sp. T-8]QID32925.1 flagellin [Hydrogenobacter sp. T-8]